MSNGNYSAPSNAHSQAIGTPTFRGVHGAGFIDYDTNKGLYSTIAQGGDHFYGKDTGIEYLYNTNSNTWSPFETGNSGILNTNMAAIGSLSGLTGGQQLYLVDTGQTAFWDAVHNAPSWLG